MLLVDLTEGYKEVGILLSGLLLISFLGTGMIRNVALKYKVIDIPVKRSSHSVPTPRGGGIAIVISWYIGISALFILGRLEKHIYMALMTGVLLGIIGFLDDLYSLKPSMRLVIQLITTLVALFFLDEYHLNFNSLNAFIVNVLQLAVTIIGIIWFINLFNFLDGIDAYASLETIFIAAGIYFFVRDPILLILIFSVLGFLYWNWPKARIFMGDIGSTQLGFVVIILGIYYHKTTDFHIVYWLMLTSIFWFDATLTLIRRLINREKLSTAHKKHAYQRIVQAGFSHLKTDLYALIINAIILSVVLISYYWKALIIPGIALIVLLLYGTTRVIDKRYPF